MPSSSSPQGQSEDVDLPFFDPSDADLIIHSSDDIEIYVYRLLLSLTSSFFKDMFSLARPGNEEDGSLPSIDLAENGQTLLNLLAFIDPRVNHNRMSLKFEEAFEVALAADKYQLDIVHDKVLPLLTQSIVENPEELFLRASLLAVQGKEWAMTVARSAAKATLTKPIDSILRANTSPQSAGELMRLIKFHTLCGEEAEKAVRSHQSPHANMTWRNLNSATAHYDFLDCGCNNKSFTWSDGWTELHYVHRYKNIVASSVSRQPLDVANGGKDFTLPLSKGLPTSGCLSKMLESCKVPFQKLNGDLVDVIQASFAKVNHSSFLSILSSLDQLHAKVDLGYSRNMGPYVL
jgi:hypothetical protein